MPRRRCTRVALRAVLAVRGHLLFFERPASSEICPLSLHDALPILRVIIAVVGKPKDRHLAAAIDEYKTRAARRSEEHTSELQSPMYLVCRLLLEKKKEKRTEQLMLTEPENT